MTKCTVTVALLGEHQKDIEIFERAHTVMLTVDGGLQIECEGRRSGSFSASAWGAFQVVRVPSAADRLKSKAPATVSGAGARSVNREPFA